MKKVVYTILAIASISVLSASCKKDYHCSCTYNNLVMHSEDLGKQSKTDAQNQCNQYVNTVPGETWNCWVY